jgi:8-oxo-dGTP diphosphatase
MSIIIPHPKIGVQAVILRDSQILTVVKNYPEGTAYILPGGSQEHGEPLDIAIKRECLEELGIEIRIDRLLFVREYIGMNHAFAATDSHIHIVNILFACQVPESYSPQMGSKPDREQISVQWLPITKLHQYQFYPTALQPYLLDLVTGKDQKIYLGDIN